LPWLCDWLGLHKIKEIERYNKGQTGVDACMRCNEHFLYHSELGRVDYNIRLHRLMKETYQTK